MSIEERLASAEAEIQRLKESDPKGIHFHEPMIRKADYEVLFDRLTVYMSAMVDYLNWSWDGHGLNIRLWQSEGQTSIYLGDDRIITIYKNKGAVRFTHYSTSDNIDRFTFLDQYETVVDLINTALRDDLLLGSKQDDKPEVEKETGITAEDIADICKRELFPIITNHKSIIIDIKKEFELRVNVFRKIISIYIYYNINNNLSNRVLISSLELLNFNKLEEEIDMKAINEMINIYNILTKK